MSDNHESLQKLEERLTAIADLRKDRWVEVDLVRTLVAVVTSQQKDILAIQGELTLIREQLRHLGIK